MSAIPKPKLTPAEYLVRERSAEFKSEYFQGEMIERARASKEHVIIATNLLGELHQALKGSPYRVCSSDQRLKVSRTDFYAYPDLAIVSDKAVYDPLDEETLLNPITIIEILSPETETFDRSAKFRQYQQIPSLSEYILVSQNVPVCERFVRRPDEGWNLTFVTALTGELAFTSVPVRIPLTMIYDGVEFPPETLR
ncbi:MAG TPA: Uma2 family endonuclease [Gemmataceae bacterium]|nr:Uma2 family endonuclease [Gemmataceae bacterium]